MAADGRRNQYSRKWASSITASASIVIQGDNQAGRDINIGKFDMSSSEFAFLWRTEH